MSLTELVAMVLDVDPASLSEDSGRGTLDLWDSLAHLNVVSAIEETYDIVLSSAEMRELTSLGALREALQKRGVEG